MTAQARLRIERFAQEARESGRTNRRLIIGIVNAEEPCAVVAPYVVGYERVLDSSAVRHVWQRRRVISQEFGSIVDIVRLAHFVRLQGSNARLSRLVYEATVSPWTYTYVEEIRRGARQLAMRTMWRR